MTEIQTLCSEFSIAPWQAQNIAELLDEGNTLPFIARYRKERHGSLDDQKLRLISERLGYLRALNKRREEIRSSLDEKGVLDEGLSLSLESAKTQAQLEDIYRPFRPKRRTRSSVAREKGLEPLADILMLQNVKMGSAQELAKPYVDTEKGVNDEKEALGGAKDILAERFSDDANVRARIRSRIWERGKLASRGAKDEDSVYRLYYDYAEPLRSVAGHRVLALNRGEAEGFLKVGVEVNELDALDVLYEFVRPGSVTSELVREAAKDAYTRLIFPSLEREARSELTQRAQSASIRVFAQNLRNLLMQPPIKGKTVLALDPGIRTGCKAAVVDGASRVLATTVIYPLPEQGRVEKSRKEVLELIERFGVTAIAVGNGTASRETERFVAQTLKYAPKGVGYTIVNEAGASVYSASRLAAEEFPDMDVSIRSAVSLARRLQDPLAELVKIDPKAIGVGQYQHDMRESELDAALSGVVEDCVNAVGVDVNTASPSLLSFVAGIGPQLAKNIVAYRQTSGPFKSRAELKLVGKLGPKAFEQCAGFLRVPESKNPLDRSAVHPESYGITEALLKKLGFAAGGAFEGIRESVMAYPEERLADELGVGLPTLSDIVEELLKPGRDPRGDLPGVELRTDIVSMDDLTPGMELKGTVRNVVDFGAFVDIGVHRDGLIHISRISKKRIAHPSEALKVGEVVTCYVVEVNRERNQISLSMLPVERP